MTIILDHSWKYRGIVNNDDINVFGYDYTIGEMIEYSRQYHKTKELQDRNIFFCSKWLKDIDFRNPVRFMSVNRTRAMRRAGFEPIFEINCGLVLWDPLESLCAHLAYPHNGARMLAELRMGPSPLTPASDNVYWKPIPIDMQVSPRPSRLLDVLGTFREYPFTPLVRLGTAGAWKDRRPIQAYMRPDGTAVSIGGSRGIKGVDNKMVFKVYSSHGQELFPVDLEGLAREADYVNELTRKALR